MNDCVFDRIVTEEDIEAAYRIILKRAVGSEEYKNKLVAAKRTLGALVEELRHSDELSMGISKDLRLPYSKTMIDDHNYRCPTFLSKTPSSKKRVMIIGSCLMDNWPAILKESLPDWAISKININNVSTLPPLDKEEAKRIDFQIIQTPLRFVVPESMYFNLQADQADDYERIFSEAVERLEINLSSLMQYNSDYGIQTFVLNFLVPQQNPMGRLFNRYHLSNMAFFVEKLNEAMFSFLQGKPDVYFVDFDQIVSGFGRKYFQDDAISHINHGANIGSLAMGEDSRRLEPIGDVGLLYTPQVKKYITCLAFEVLALHRTISQVDAIKLVVFDLDDTLWRGVPAEMDDIGPEVTEGWPISILEALAFLWKRGILVAIVSKNDESKAREIWKKLHGYRFSLDKFVSVQIGWGSKAEAVGRIIEQTNLLPDSVLFVDDNPAERASVQAAYPSIRTLGAPLAEWRRILLWSPELQRSSLTQESVGRTSMVRAQITREAQRSKLDNASFLKSLNLKISVCTINSMDHPRADRAFELLNKTNQFNSTGRRWETSELVEFLKQGGELYALDVEDIHTPYGLTCLALKTNASFIEQMVMSCRVFGLGIENALLWIVTRGDATVVDTPLTIRYAETGRNSLAISFLKQTGRPSKEPGAVDLVRESVEKPDHIEIAYAGRPSQHLAAME